MPNKWIGFIIFVWVVCMFMGATFEHHTTVAGTWEGGTQESTLEYLLNVKNIATKTDQAGGVHFVGFNADYFSTLWQIFTWDFTFLRDTGYEMLRWIVLMPFSIACAFGLLYSFIQLLQGFIPHL